MKKETKLINIYVDMDGVLVDFNGETEALKRFESEAGFFRKLKPLRKNLDAVKRVIADGRHNVFIISASPTGQADYDKRLWLCEYLGELRQENIIIMRLGQNKTDYMKTADGILFDDYGQNIQEWVKIQNNRAVKIKRDGDVADGIRAIEVMSDIVLNS